MKRYNVLSLILIFEWIGDVLQVVIVIVIIVAAFRASLERFWRRDASAGTGFHQ